MRDRFTIGCVAAVIVAAIAAATVLDVLNRGSDVTRVGNYLVSVVGFVATLLGIASVRKGVGKTNEDINNGVLRQKVKEGIHSYLNENGGAIPSTPVAWPPDRRLDPAPTPPNPDIERRSDGVPN